MREVKPTYTAGVVLVCGNQRVDPEDASCGVERATALRNWLKDRIKEEKLKGAVLSSRTTCLGLCSKHGVTVDIVPTPGHGTRRMLIVDPEADREALWTQVKACLLGADAAAPAFLPDEEL